MTAPTYEASLVAVVPQSSGPPTFTEVCGLVPTSLTIVDELGQPGKCELTTVVNSIEANGKARLRDLSVAPTELWVRRTTYTTAGAVIASPQVFAGAVTSYHIQDRSITLTAPGLLAYLLYWLRDSDYSANLLDQATIVQQLCDQWQAQPYGHDGIVTTGLTATGVPRILNLSGRDGKKIMPVIAEMGVRNNGFDLSVDPATRALKMWSPRKGVDRSTGPAAVILDRRSIGVPDLQVTVAPDALGSEVFASSSSTLGTTLTSIQSNTALRQSFGRSYITRSYEDISEQSTLDDHALRELADASTQVITGAPVLLPVPGFSYDDFATGDTIIYSYDAGLGEQTFTPRVNIKEVSTSSGREMLAVGFV